MRPPLLTCRPSRLSWGAKVSASQADVWNSVAKEQQKLSAAVHGSVAAEESDSSYQLTLEHEKVQERIKPCVETLRKDALGYEDTVGFVFAIGDELNSADFYVNHDLFIQLWDKLLDAAATEAVAESHHPKQLAKAKLTTKDVEEFSETQDMAGQEPRLVTPRVQLRQYGNGKRFRFETEDMDKQATCVHANVMSH